MTKTVKAADLAQRIILERRELNMRREKNRRALEEGRLFLKSELDRRQPGKPLRRVIDESRMQLLDAEDYTILMDFKSVWEQGDRLAWLRMDGKHNIEKIAQYAAWAE